MPPDGAARFTKLQALLVPEASVTSWPASCRCATVSPHKYAGHTIAIRGLKALYPLQTEKIKHLLFSLQLFIFIPHFLRQLLFNDLLLICNWKVHMNEVMDAARAQRIFTATFWSSLREAALVLLTVYQHRVQKLFQ